MSGPIEARKGRDLSPKDNLREVDPGRSHLALRGREEEMALVSGLIQRIDQGGASLLITGEPGIGKSALLEFARQQAGEAGLTVLAMTGAPAETHLPFAALEQAVRSLMKHAPALVPRQRSALQAAFGLGDDATAPDIYLVALAALALLAEQAARRPVLLAVDDAQWLDEATYDVLNFISRRLSADPILLLVGMREDFNRPFGDASTTRRRLDRLARGDAEQLLDATAPGLPADVRERFLSEAAGNPLALLELPRFRDRPEPDAPWLPLTERLEHSFLARLKDLPDTVRTLLMIAAENDGPVVEEVLRAGELLLQRSIGIADLLPALAANLVGIHGAQILFRHPLIRSAMHQVADAATRQSIHSALAMVVEGQPDRQLWHRAIATLGADDDLAGEYDRMAARALRRGTVAMAVDILETAARLSSTARARSDRLLRAAELAADLGKPELLERLLAKAGEDNSDPLAPARIGWCREICRPATVDDPARIPALLAFAIQARTAGAKDLAANLLWRAAQHCWWSNADDDLRHQVLVALACLDLPQSDPRSIAISAYVEPLRLGGLTRDRLQALSGGRDVDAGVLRMLGSTADVVGAFDLGASFLMDSAAALRAQGRLSDLARVLFALAWAKMEIGDWAGAGREAEEASRLAEETGGDLWIAAATIVKARVYAAQGNVERFEAETLQAERLVVPAGANFLLAMLQLARGTSALGAGRQLEAYEHLRRLFAPADPAYNRGLKFFGLDYFTEAAVATGHLAAARQVVEETQELAGEVPTPWVQTMLLYAKALLAAPEEAESLFLAGLGPAAKKWPFLRGRILFAYGIWLRRQRRSADARAPLREARDVFDALGASPWSDRAREELRASGEGSRRRAEHAWEALSPQELHIAQLATEGLSNKEIGARLFLSHRTVGYHLHRIFAKTGVTSRAGLRPLLAGGDDRGT